MDSVNGSEVAVDLFPIIRVYKDGRVDRLIESRFAPAGFDEKTGVRSKDVTVSPEFNVSARIYLPKLSAGGDPSRKLPLLVYFHGGAFVIGTATSEIYHNYLNTLVAESQIVAVSVGYRRAPEHPLPAAYGDSWAALKWVASHSGGTGPDRWVNEHADLNRVFLAGDSAGANIAHRMAVRSGTEELGGGVNFKGIVLVHPYFWGEDPVEGELVRPEMIARLWRFAYPDTVGSDDPWINPAKDPELKKTGCGKVLVCVAQKDALKHRGRHYYELIKKSGWVGSVEIVESDGEGHVFHLLGDPTSKRVVALLHKVSSFINEN